MHFKRTVSFLVTPLFLVSLEASAAGNCSDAFKFLTSGKKFTYFYSYSHTYELARTIESLEGDIAELEAEIRKLKPRPKIHSYMNGPSWRTRSIGFTFGGGSKPIERVESLPEKMSKDDEVKLERLEETLEDQEFLLEEREDELNEFLETKEKEKVLKRIKKLSSHNIESKNRADEIYLEHLMDNLGSEKVKFVTLAFNSSKKDDFIKNQIISIIRKYKEDPSVIFLYSKESKQAPLIDNLTKGRSIVLTNGESDFSKNIFHMSNIHLKLSIFLNSDRIYTDTRSYTGLALQFMSSAATRVNVIEKNIVFRNPDKWIDSSMSHQLGLKKLGVEITSLFSYREIFGFSKPDAKEALKDLNTGWDSLNFDELLDIESEVIRHAQGRVVLSKVNGAAIFGSSKSHEEFGDHTYNVAYELGIRSVPVITGGSGGMMLAANMGAKHGGSKSIGVPVGSSSKLSLTAEKKSYSDYHTETVVSSGYDNRIPFLIEGRESIIFVPGGNGTVRELAATLIYVENLINRSEEIPTIIFTSPKGDYYGKLRAIFNSHRGIKKLVGTKIFWLDDPAAIGRHLSSKSPQKGNYQVEELQGIFEEVNKPVVSYGDGYGFGDF